MKRTFASFFQIKENSLKLNVRTGTLSLLLEKLCHRCRLCVMFSRIECNFFRATFAPFGCRLTLKLHIQTSVCKNCPPVCKPRIFDCFDHAEGGTRNRPWLQMTGNWICIFIHMKTAFAHPNDSLAQMGEPMQEPTFLGCLLLARHFPPLPKRTRQL